MRRPEPVPGMGEGMIASHAFYFYFPCVRPPAPMS